MPTRPARDATISDELPAGHSASLLRTPYGGGRFVPSLSPEVCGLSRASYRGSLHSQATARLLCMLYLVQIAAQCHAAWTLVHLSCQGEFRLIPIGPGPVSMHQHREKKSGSLRRRSLRLRILTRPVAARRSGRRAATAWGMRTFGESWLATGPRASLCGHPCTGDASTARARRRHHDQTRHLAAGKRPLPRASEFIRSSLQWRCCQIYVTFEISQVSHIIL
jgi:hypothetical protein